MLLVYTGSGKGKTSACVGQCVRAAGQGLRVTFAQFMKTDGVSGEQTILPTLPNVRWYAGGRGFFRFEKQRDAHRAAALDTLAWATDALTDCDMLVLDESLYALGAGLLTQEELQDIIERTAAHGVHLVLSGRGLPPWLEAQADLVTEMREVRHPMQQGIPATRGIEF